MKHVDVVIISWAKNEELLQVTRTGLDSLFGSEPAGDVTFHAYVVESNPDVNYDEYNNSHRRHTTTTIHPNEEFGYHKYLNIGRRAGNSPYVVLCNSDLTYENYWASNIIRIMEQYPQFMSASPWCPQTQNDNTPHLSTVFEGYRVRGEIAGWCIFQQRKIYDIIGELDERFKFWYCDNDYSMDLQVKGVKHCLVPMSVVNHHENQLGKTGDTLNQKERYDITYAQQKVFEEKWKNFIARGPK
jgi:GT2 family glycosyltransferase